jgi:hypothetical protein
VGRSASSASACAGGEGGSGGEIGTARTSVRSANPAPIGQCRGGAGGWATAPLHGRITRHGAQIGNIPGDRPGWPDLRALSSELSK